MRASRLLSSASALAILSFVSASHVIDLTSASFESLVNSEPLMLVEFFAPWCGHCKALGPHYEEAAAVLKDKNIKLAKVNCVDEADFCQANGIQGYPTMRVYRNGEFSDYSGTRLSDGIISYMIKQSLPAVSEVTSAVFEEFKQADKIVAVAFLSSPTDAPAPEFSATANKHRDDYLFGLVTDPSLAETAGVTPPAIVLYRSFDEPVTEYPYPVLSANLTDIAGWIKELSIPVFDEVSGDNYQLYAQSGKPLAYLFVDPSDERKEEHIESIRPVASKFKQSLNFVWIDAVKYSDHARALNLNDAKWPSFVIQDMASQLKYPHDQSVEITAEAVHDLTERFVSKRLEATLKSQPVPASQEESVFDLVGKQFEEVVFDDSKDVFVEFYASWCGHCKRLKPTWDSLADRYVEVKDRITIAKMEATENDLPPSVDFKIAGFPTLKFKKAGSRHFVDYDGDRSLESLIAFVEENARNSLEPPLKADIARNETVEQAHAAQEQFHVDHHDEL